MHPSHRKRCQRPTNHRQWTGRPLSELYKHGQSRDNGTNGNGRIKSTPPVSNRSHKCQGAQTTRKIAHFDRFTTEQIR